MIDDWLKPVYRMYGGYGYYLFQTGVPRWLMMSFGILALCGGAFFFLVDRKQFLQNTFVLILIEYISFLISSAVVFRPENADSAFSLIPLWSYRAILSGKSVLVMEIFLNVIIFIPLGFLGGLLFKGDQIKKVFLLGFSVSFVIELLQYICKRGFAEVDDLIHNTIGCLLGYLLCTLLFRVLLFTKNFFHDNGTRMN